MSVIDSDGRKVLLPRVGPDEFWLDVIEAFPEGNPRRWRYLAMLALRENAGWPLDRIGLALGHNKGHVQRCLERIKEELRERLGEAPNDRFQMTNKDQIPRSNPDKKC